MFARCSALLLFCVSALCAQVSLNESSLKAAIDGGHTSISAGIENLSKEPQAAVVRFEWLDVSDKPLATREFNAELKPGLSNVALPMPLPSGTDDLRLLRLRYTIAPANPNPRSFYPFEGIVQFASFAPYVFSLQAFGPDAFGKNSHIWVAAFNPETHVAVAGVMIRADTKQANTDRDGIAELQLGDAHSLDARIGDFTAHLDLDNLPQREPSVRIETDKPIYQPGQTVHMRAVLLDDSGHAAAGTKEELRVTDEVGDPAHIASVMTSKFGIAATDWVIPSDADPGTYTIDVSSAGAEQNAANITVRPYELPSFRVSASTDKPFYLDGQRAEITIRAAYLFGKPLPNAPVSIEEDGTDNPLWSGALDNNATAHAAIPLPPLRRWQPYADTTYIAFVTDPSTKRTEQQKFDIRVSRYGLHLYLSREERVTSGFRLYATVYLPDGTPARATVRADTGQQCETNRFGVCALDVPPAASKVSASTHAATSDAVQLTHFEEDGPQFHLDRVLYAPGIPVKCHIEWLRHDFTVLLLGWNTRNEVVFDRVVNVRDTADVAIPYTSAFGSQLHLSAIVPSAGSTTAQTALFPGAETLHDAATANKQVYRPGAEARIDFHVSQPAALGIAITDAAVQSRVSTDSGSASNSIQRPPSVEDLLALPPQKIDPDLDLYARTVVPESTAYSTQSADWKESIQSAFEQLFHRRLAPVEAQMNDYFVRHLEYSESFLSAVAARVKDAWDQPFFTKSRILGSDNELCVMTSGPDKLAESDDDFCAATFTWSWFGAQQYLIGKALESQPDFPATREDFQKLLASKGILFSALRDPWGNPLNATVETQGAQRSVLIHSPHANEVAASFQGTWFRAEGNKILAALEGAPRLPATKTEAIEILRAAGIQFEELRSPWGTPLTLKLEPREVFEDRIEIYTVSEYQHAPEQRERIVPIKSKQLLITITGKYPDEFGDEQSFTVLTYTLRDKAKSLASPDQAKLTGHALIEGLVTDPTGAVIPGAVILLNGKYAANSDEKGRYLIRVPEGRFELQASSPGFQTAIVTNVQTTPGQTSRVDFELQVGVVTQTVEVSSTVPTLETNSAEIGERMPPPPPPPSPAVAPAQTPRVRQYFPETLYWNPEVDTDARGTASITVPLADSITEWNVRATASTLDGETAQAASTFRTFQPFAIDLDLPPTLTHGDQVAVPISLRNYLERTLTVNLKTTGFGADAHAAENHASIASNSYTDVSAHLSASVDGTAKLRVVATGRDASDSMEKVATVHPDGQLMRRSSATVADSTAGMTIEVPAAAIPGSLTGTVRIYPDLLSRLVEAVDVLAERPSGCAEQITSAAYANLLLLRALKNDSALKRKAQQNVELGYERLLAHQTAEGGFTYWGSGAADIAVTAYAVQFLSEAAPFLNIDAERVEKARAWLAKQDPKSPELRALVADAFSTNEELAKLAMDAAKFDDPYALSVFALAAMNAQRPDLAARSIAIVTRSAKEVNGAALWSLATNTPFHGWGHAGQLETTAKAVQALAGWSKLHPDDEAAVEAAHKGAVYLLRNTAAGGAWDSSQATVQALLALLASMNQASDPNAVFTIRVNGIEAARLKAQGNEPLSADISRLLKSGQGNKVELACSQTIQAAFDASWYQPWHGDESAADLKFSAQLNTDSAKPGDAVSYHVHISRPSFRGYGMLIARVGLPPGAEVDRGILESLVDHGAVDRFEVTPDAVTFYVWPKAGDDDFSFVFRPRYAETAKTTGSITYDFYNPDDRAVVAPVLFNVRD